MEKELINEWQNLIIENATIIQTTEKVNIITQDPDDNKFIEAAIAGKADYIISQDKHLLNLKEYNGIKIIIPEEFLGKTKEQ